MKLPPLANFFSYNVNICIFIKGGMYMEKEIVYKRSRKDILMYLLLVIIADLGCAYMILCGSYILGIISLIIFGVATLYSIKLLIIPNAILTVNKEGIKTKYTKGKYITWNEISEIYIDKDSYKDRPVDVLAIKLKKEGQEVKNIKFPQPKNKVRGDYNVNLQYSDGKLEDAYTQIRDFYRNNIK